MTKEAQTAQSAALSRSASSNTIMASLPPSSKVTGVRFAAAERITSLPVSVLPVNTILFTPGDAARALLVPGPWIAMTRSSGKPDSLNISDISCPVRGVSLDGFSITELPAATAATVCVKGIARGKLKGAITATTPSGRYST